MGFSLSLSRWTRTAEQKGLPAASAMADDGPFMMNGNVRRSYALL